MSSLHGKEGVCLGRATDVNATQYKLKIAEVAELEPGSNNCELGSNFNAECGATLMLSVEESGGILRLEEQSFGRGGASTEKE